MAMFIIAKDEYIKWLKSDKQILTALSFICLYMYTFQPLNRICEQLGGKMLITEPFLTLINNGFCVPIVVITFIVSVIDFPNFNGNAMFIVTRVGRIRWYNGQLLFVLFSALTFIFVCFFFSVFFTASNTSIMWEWSETAKLIHIPQNEELKIQYPFAVLDLSVMNNFKMPTAFFLSVMLLLLHLLLCAQLQMILSIQYGKIAGMCVNIAVLGMGLVLWAADIPAKWFFPFSHSVIGWHYDELYNIVAFPVSLSAIYILGLNTILYFIGRKAIKKLAITSTPVV